jgi:hypothetical protein
MLLGFAGLALAGRRRAKHSASLLKPSKLVAGQRGL